MQYKTFGKTGLQISKMALGTWGIGGAGWDTYADDVRIDAILAAIENGVNLIDTAPAYNAGAAEKLLGRALQQSGLRDKVYISTKCGNEFIDGKYVRNGRPERILSLCDESLERLQTEYVDIMLVHWPDPNVPFSETMPALQQLKEEGKIRHIGVSNFSQEQIEEAGRYCEIEVLQPQYSMVNRNFESLMQWARSQNIATMAYGALGGGILTGRYRSVQTFEAMDSRNRFYPFFKEPMFSQVMKLLDVMDRIAADHGVPVAQVALNWTAEKDFVSTCLVGAQTRDKVEQNAAAFSWSLEEEEKELLNQAVSILN